MRLPLISLLPVLLSACGGDTVSRTEPAASEVHQNASVPTGTTSTAIPLNGCYEMVFKRDTARMQLELRDSTITGTLEYRLYEKDRNTGTLKGVVRDSLIVADYTFSSEGSTSVREVVFRIEDTALVPAHGDIEERSGRLVFRDRSRLQYETANPFLRFPCSTHNDQP
ncbi:MAG TPA: hypothetical protein VHK69_11160 [Chitinophagaceae bacterium]|jgi:pullulanase/glycogen debranching enzyme|nr:hypothetical protein [Chitinophagaceae bacterium]